MKTEMNSRHKIIREALATFYIDGMNVPRNIIIEAIRNTQSQKLPTNNQDTLKLKRSNLPNESK